MDSYKSNADTARVVFWCIIASTVLVSVAAILTIIEKVIDLQKKMGGG